MEVWAARGLMGLVEILMQALRATAQDMAQAVAVALLPWLVEMELRV
jgi:hypothetical protein